MPKTRRRRWALPLLGGVAILCLAAALAPAFLRARESARTEAAAQSRQQERRRNVEKSVAFLETRAASDPTGATGIALLAQAYLERATLNRDDGDRVRAESMALRSVTTRAKNNAIGWYVLARSRMARHDFAAALTAIHGRDTVLEAECLIELGRYDDARNVLGDAAQARTKISTMTIARSKLALDPGALALSARLWQLTGEPELALKASDDAVAAAKELRTLPPETLAWFLARRAQQLSLMGKHADARAELDTALELAPEEPRVLLAAATRALGDGRFADAETLARKADKIAPSLEAASVLADSLEFSGKVADADMLRDRLTKNGAAAGHERAFALFLADNKRQPERAVELAKQAAKSRPSVESFDALAWCLLCAGDAVGANAAMERVRKFGPIDPLIFFHDAEIQTALGKQAEAKTLYERALTVDKTFHPRFSGDARKRLAAPVSLAKP